MSRSYQVVWAGRHRRTAWEDLCRGYRRRIARFVPARDRPIKVKTRGEDAVRRQTEGQALLAALPDPCYVVALDRDGETLSSRRLAERLEQLEREWPHPVGFVVGSDLGLDPAVLERARLRLSFGPMTFGHELARLMLYEQIYRALAIARGIKYHRPPL